MLACPKCGDLCPPGSYGCGSCGSWLTEGTGTGTGAGVRRKPADAARYEVAKAIRQGRLVRGECAHASSGRCSLPIEGHHEDYAKPLDVIWLCGGHHRQLHADRRYAARMAAA